MCSHNQEKCCALTAGRRSDKPELPPNRHELGCNAYTAKCVGISFRALVSHRMKTVSRVAGEMIARKLPFAALLRGVFVHTLPHIGLYLLLRFDGAAKHAHCRSPSLGHGVGNGRIWLCSRPPSRKGSTLISLLGACRLLLLARLHTLDHSLRTIDFELEPRSKTIINQNL